MNLQQPERTNGKLLYGFLELSSSTSWIWTTMQGASIENSDWGFIELNVRAKKITTNMCKSITTNFVGLIDSAGAVLIAVAQLRWGFYASWMTFWTCKHLWFTYPASTHLHIFVASIAAVFMSIADHCRPYTFWTVRALEGAVVCCGGRRCHGGVGGPSTWASSLTRDPLPLTSCLAIIRVGPAVGAANRHEFFCAYARCNIWWT